MAQPVKNQMAFWAAAAVVFLLLLWALGNVILPFLLGGAIAYCLDPIADRLENIGFSRVLATITITLGAIVLFVLAILLVVPALVEQLIGLIEAAPKLVSDLQTFLTTRFPDLLDGDSQLSQSVVSVAGSLQSKLGVVLESVLTSAAGLLNMAVLIFLVPVITFYLLLDWDRMVGEVDKLLPRDHATVIRKLLVDINDTLASFIRGQGTVCLILGIYYAAALMLVGLQFGLVIGFVAGLVSFIPYVGALIGGVLAIGLALYQFWGEWVWIGAVVAIFMLGQFFEGNILTPKLVGGSVGLHPVWLIFSLSAFGALFGFAGLLVAVPVAAVIGVVTRFGLMQYRQSHLYQGASGQIPDPDTTGTED